MAYIPKMIYTSNPFADYVIYWTKYMAMNAVTKNEAYANSLDTLESVKNFEYYTICSQNKQTYTMWDSYPIEIYNTVLKGVYTERYIELYILHDPMFLDEQYQQAVADEMARVFLSDYQELNPYYREICGLRPLDSELYVKLEDYGFVNDPATQDNISYTYLHELPPNILYRLQVNGILDKIISDYPDEKWVQNLPIYIESSNILTTISDCRKAAAFELLYLPDVDEVIKEQFVEKYNINREYVLHNVYSEAFKIGSDYYDNFIQILIIIMTVADMLDNVSDHVVRKDIIDSRCIKYIFEQYGIPYYEEIPIKYQVAMMKNLNTLLKFKSSARCMIDICSLFGFDSSQVFQLYLLRKRKVDDDGNFIFNYKTIQSPKEVGIVHKSSTIIKLTEDQNKIKLDYPISEYFEKGNKIEVWVDKELLSDEYYHIANNYLYLDDMSVLANHSNIEIKYLYNEDNLKLATLPRYDIERTDEILMYNKFTDNYQLHPPVDNYFNDSSGLVYIIFGTILLHNSLYTIDNDILSFTSDFYNDYDKIDTQYMRIIYLYSNAIKINNISVDVPCTETNQSSFLIPEPFEGYCEGGNKFFLTVGGTYISTERYYVSKNTLIFNNSDDIGVSKGQNITFHFIYNNFSDVELIDTSTEIVATKAHQLIFDIPVPYDAYFTDGNMVFVSVNNIFLDPSKYSITNNQIHLHTNYSVYEGNRIQFRFIYGKNTNIKHTQTFVTATLPYQQDFRIPWPYEGFLARRNQIKIFYKGIEYIRDEDFIIKGDFLEIFTVNKSISKGDSLEFDFYFYPENSRNITIKETKTTVLREGQLKYNIPVPFYNYFNTGSKVIITIGSTFVPETEYVINDDRLIFNENHSMDLSLGRSIMFTFIYHTAYEEYNNAVYQDTTIHDLSNFIENPDGSLKIRIPFPFDQYLELGNEFEMRVDGTHPIPIEAYDIIDNAYVLIFEPKTYVYPYGVNIQFNFTYSCSGYEDKVVEDLEKDIELKFVKVPLLKNPDPYLKKETDYLDYDSVVSADSSWNGDYTHAELKKALIEKQFSYNRTKYFSITSLSSMASVAYQLPYFMNMILDNVKHEERLTLKLPYIHATHIFKFNDVLTYMMALSHRYVGVVDDIPNIQRALYIKGFNFEADMASISSYISEKLGTSSVLANMKIDPIWQRFNKMENQVPTYKELIDIYTTNTDIYNHVVHEMLNADNKVIFDIYKKIYESLMIVKESKEYFRINRDKMATTITEWLQYRDDYLYQSLLTVDKLKDDEVEMKKTISKYLEDCIYQISEYIDSTEFRHVLNHFEGANTDALIGYLTKVINFFKSYKIQLYDVAIEYLFDDKLENTIRAIDYLTYSSVTYLDDDGYDIYDTIYQLISFIIHDKEVADTVKERVRYAIIWWLQSNPKDRINLDEYIMDCLVKFIIYDRVDIIEKLPITSIIELTDRFEDIISDLANIISVRNDKDKVKLRERYYQIIRKYILSTNLDKVQLYEELHSLINSIISENVIDDNIKEHLTGDTYMTLYEIHANPTDNLIYLVYTYSHDIVSLSERIHIITSSYTYRQLSSDFRIQYDDMPFYSTNFNLTSYGSPIDDIRYLISSIHKEDINISDSIGDTFVTMFWTYLFKIIDKAVLDISLDHKESISNHDTITSTIDMVMESYYGDLLEEWYFKIHFSASDMFNIDDMYTISSFINKNIFAKSYMNIHDTLSIKTMN